MFQNERMHMYLRFEPESLPSVTVDTSDSTNCTCILWWETGVDIALVGVAVALGIVFCGGRTPISCNVPLVRLSK